MKIYVLTLFPEMFSCMNHSIIGRAQANGVVEIEYVNFRDFATDTHKHVDDYPYGGGAGMVIKAQPLYDAYDSIKSRSERQISRVIYMSPQGAPLTQNKARELSREEDLIILCGHYEGIDERIIEEIVTEEISIGDYIITGGELGAMVIIDAVSRLLPGVLGKDESSHDESFSDGLLEYPHYTRPYEFMGRKVPDVLLSGHHAEIEKWRREQSQIRTHKKRPDLL